MVQQGGWLQRAPWGKIGILALLIISPGCLRFVHPIKAPPASFVAPSAAIPPECRQHVYVFLVHGMDPLDLANLNGVRQYILNLGYNNVYLGQMYHVWEFEKTLCKIHREDPQARFVVMGFSFGANLARNIVNAAKKENVTIDLLVYTGGNTLENNEKCKPANVMHIVNILATGCIWNGDHLDGATNLHYDDVWHFGSPSHRKTQALLAEHLALVASRVPPHETAFVSPPVQGEIGLVPQAAPGPKIDVPANWAFLEKRDPKDEPHGFTTTTVSRLKPQPASAPAAGAGAGPPRNGN